MWKIKNQEILTPVVLGPMAGITTAAYRAFMKPFGVGLAYSEMISDCGLIYGNKETLTYLKNGPGDCPLALQLFGGSGDTLLQAVKIIEHSDVKYDFLDINLGCPVPKVIKTGAGSAWLRRPEELETTMREIVNVSSKPVTAKIRLGWDEESINFREIIKRLERAGVSMIALHLRTRSALYSGHVDYSLATNLQAEMGIPLVISGDIFTAEDAFKALKITGAQAVMVARGALGHPELITQINSLLSGMGSMEETPLTRQLDYMLAFSQKLIDEKGEEIAVRQLRGMLPKFLNGYPQMKEFKTRLVNEIVHLTDIERIIEEIRNKSQNY